MNGWIKLPRDILEEEIFKNATLLKVYVWALAKAVWQPCEVLVGNQLVRLEPGQFVSGRKAAAAELRIDESTFRRATKTLTQMGKISLKTTNKFTILTVENWGFLQGGCSEFDQQANQQVNQQKATIEERKKSKKSFTKPTIVEIATYCEERKNSINPESFFDFYEARGWMLGKSKMKDWKAAVRTWERNSKGGSENKAAAEPDYYV